jgi:opacity protein-like surface antigen
MHSRDLTYQRQFMKKFLGISALLFVVLSLAKPTGSYGQDFFRDLGTSRSSGGIGPVVPSDYSYQDGSPSGLRELQPGQELALPNEMEDADRYNFALGNFRFGLAVGVGVEWNDNITLSEKNRISDFIFRPVLNLEARWQMSELNTLRFNIGVSYAKYFEHSEYDTNGILISPTSDLAFTFFVGTVKFTLRERFSYQEDTYDVPELSNNAIYGRYENQLGAEIEWAINQSFDVTVGYDHYNLWASEDDFSNQDRVIDTIFLKPGIQINPAIKVGVNASLSFINFDSNDRSDGSGFLVGPYIEWQLSEYTNLYLEAGYQSLKFDGASDYNNEAIDVLGLSADDAAAVRGVLEDNSDSSNFYVKFEINNRPSEVFRHRLSYSHTAEIGFASNYYEIDHVEYNADWKPMEHVELGPTLFYEHYTTSGSLGEDADRIGAALGIRYHFNNSLTLGLDYRYIWKNSNLEGADYYQNLAFLSLYYKF